MKWNTVSSMKSWGHVAEFQGCKALRENLRVCDTIVMESQKEMEDLLLSPTV